MEKPTQVREQELTLNNLARKLKSDLNKHVKGNTSLDEIRDTLCGLLILAIDGLEQAGIPDDEEDPYEIPYY